MNWQIDPAHSHISFSVRHMMISKVRGFFDNFSGTIDFDEQNPANTAVDISIDASSINTRDEQRDGHLKSPDFLNVAEYPNLTFVGKRIEQDDTHNGRLMGDLTILDQTHEVTLDVHYTGIAKSPYGNESAGFQASTNISRKMWGLEWNVALETGGWLVGDKINIDIELELVKVPETEAAAAG
jgi:polyisoprenoid-binding protein YceI